VSSEIWSVAGSAEVARKRYSGEEGLDKDLETFRLSSMYKMERNDLMLHATRINDTTLSDDPEDPDLGRATVQRSRRMESLQPTWIWSATERSRIQLSYMFSDVSYAGGEDISLFDYRQRTATATWSYLLTPLSQVFLTANLSEYRAPSISLESQIPTTGAGVLTLASSVDSESPNFRVGMSWSFSETMQGTVSVGQRKTTAERTIQDCLYNAGNIVACVNPRTVSTDDSGTTYSADFSKKFEKFSIAAKGSRDITASGAGTEVEWDTLGIWIERPFTPRFRATMSVAGSKSRRIIEVVTSTTDIKQYSLQPALHWLWTREADLSLAYRYSHLQREDEDQAAQSRAIILSFLYTWTKLSISR
jgi:hypothetical protein